MKLVVSDVNGQNYWVKREYGSPGFLEDALRNNRFITVQNLRTGRDNRLATDKIVAIWED